LYYYIINPAAGKGAINSIQDKLRDRLKALDISGEFAKTTGPGDATKMAEQAAAKGFTTIVAVGGDGTVNEVLNGLTSSTAAIGIIPIGSTNELADHFGIGSWQQACEVLAARRITSYGLIAAGSNFFLSTLSIGFETDLDKNVDTAPTKGLGGKVGQFRASMQHAREFEPLRCTLTVDDKLEVTADMFSLSLSNHKFDNPLADNELVISLIEKPSTPRLTGYLWKHLKRGDNATQQAATTRLYGSSVLIKTDPATGIMIDGQLSGRTPIAIRLTDRRIRFITEKHTPDLGSGL
jgi:diacylglycerol kinase (ATP)